MFERSVGTSSRNAGKGRSRDAPVDQRLEFFVVNPHRLSDGFDRSNVGIGTLQDVFELRELLRDDFVSVLARVHEGDKERKKGLTLT